MPVTLAPEKLADSKIKGILENPGFMPAVLISHLTAQEKLEKVEEKDLELLINFPELMDALWLADKPVMDFVNKQDNELIFKLLLGEIEEKIEEHQLRGSDAANIEKEILEFVDLLIFISTMAINGNQEPFSEIRYASHLRLAKIANSSGVYERLKELAAEILENNDRRSFEEFFAISVSLAVNFPIKIDLSKAFNAVLEKNRRNYPAEYFQATDFFSGEKLSAEEMVLKYSHVRRCLKLLRYHESGNLIDYHAHFAVMIHQFRASDEALRQLEEAVDRMLIRGPQKENRVEMLAGNEYQVSGLKSGLEVASSLA